jgi:multiple sugar transport system permease protein
MDRAIKNRMGKQEAITGYLFLSPSLFLFAVFILFPILYGFGISFTDYGGFNLKANFVGLQNFVNMASDDYFQISIRNNLFYLVTFVPLTILLSLVSALALNQVKVFKKLLRMVFYFPQISSMVAVAMIWSILLNPSKGPVNTVLQHLSIQSPPEWLMSPSWAMFAIVIVSVWKEFGYYMIILLAGIQGIPDHLYESASLDGAGGWSKFLYITLPMLSPTLFVVLILTIISSFQVFDLVAVMTGGGPGRATNVLVYRLYQEAFMNYHVGYASAMAVVLFLIIFLITALQFKFGNQWVVYS